MDFLEVYLTVVAFVLFIGLVVEIRMGHPETTARPPVDLSQLRQVADELDDGAVSLPCEDQLMQMLFRAIEETARLGEALQKQRRERETAAACAEYRRQWGE